MRKDFLRFLSFFLVFFSSSAGFADLSISFEELKKNLQNIFTEDQFTDLRGHLSAQFEIWGYDAGDFSGDGLPDLALSIRVKGNPEKKVSVYFFVNGGKNFIVAKSMEVEYYEIPIEVGFTVEHSICFMTQKVVQHHWFISGYTYKDGNFILVDRYEVGRRYVDQGQKVEIGYEVYNNYVNLKSSESFFNTTNGKVYLKTQYYTFPAYRIGKNLPWEYFNTVSDTSTKYFLSRKEGWKGPQDLNFTSSLYYDERYLYCFIDVVGDTLVVSGENLTDNDHVQLWFDVNPTRINAGNGTAPNFRIQADDNIYLLSIMPGNNRSIKPKVHFSLRKEPTVLQRNGIREIKLLTEKTQAGYTLQLKIPYAVFDRSSLPEYIGFTIQVNDVDGQNGAVRRTSMATSQLREWDPSSFGAIRFLPDHKFYGEVHNLVLDEILKRMKEIGL